MPAHPGRDTRRLVRDPPVQQTELALRDEELRRARTKLEDLRRKYLDLQALAPVGYFAFDVEAVITDVNPAGAAMVGVDRRQLIGMGFGAFLDGENQGKFHLHRQGVMEGGSAQECELNLVRSDGKVLSVSMKSIVRPSLTDETYEFDSAVTDITMMLNAAEALSQDRQALECTTALAQTDRTLKAHMENRKRAEIALLEKTTELEAQSARLAEVKAALKVLLKQRDQDRRELEENVLVNINELVRPHLARLMGRNLKRREKELLGVIEASLDDIVSPLARKLTVELARLSPAETRIANFIRQGRSTKEIADVMGLATCTIDFHRHNIRHKLGLRHKGINLATYLTAIT
ncbi:MAG: PAS and helix-turn-helix domain-containing protein [Desulfobacterales bacterium]